MEDELYLNLQDTEWPYIKTTHDRNIVRAIVVDDDYNYYFVRAVRNDIFGNVTLIETSGGGVENGEEFHIAIKRELSEELGIECDIICKIGVVSDYYNLIYRHNINNYFLCKIKSFGEKHLTDDEINDFHLSTLCLSYDDAVNEYIARSNSKLGKLIANRELPILMKAHSILSNIDNKV